MESRRYIDFKLYITMAPGADAACQVALLPTPEVGESMSPVTIPAADAPTPELLDALADKTISGPQLVALGKRLAKCLLPEEGQIRERFRVALEEAGIAGGVRLRLIIADHRLARWPWEYVYLALVGGPDSLRGFLALNPRISIVRHVPLPIPHPGPEVERHEEMKEFRIALVGAVASTTPTLEVDKDLDGIQRAIGGVEIDGLRVTCAPVIRDATVEDLERALLHPGQVEALHFSGHGGAHKETNPYGSGYVEEGFLVLLRDKASKEHRRLAAEDFARMLARGGVRLAVLSACRTGDQEGPDAWGSVAGALVAARIPAVVAMQSKVNDRQSVAFSTAFYGALAAGVSLDEAMSLGRAAMLCPPSADEDAPIDVEWGVPVLYTRMLRNAPFPERMAKAGASAATIRQALTSTAELLEKGGSFMDAKLNRVKSGLKIEHLFDTITGDGVVAALGKTEADAELTMKSAAKKVLGSVVKAVIAP